LNRKVRFRKGGGPGKTIGVGELGTRRAKTGGRVDGKIVIGSLNKNNQGGEKKGGVQEIRGEGEKKEKR